MGKHLIGPEQSRDRISTVLIGREQFHHQGRNLKLQQCISLGKLLIGREQSRDLVSTALIGREKSHRQGRHWTSPIIALGALFCGNIVARGRYGSSVSTVLIG